MNLISLQFALFSVEPIKRPDLLHEEINSKLGKILDAMPMMLNLPENAPAEIPLVQARSSNGRYSMNISRTRIDFIITPDFDVKYEPIDIYKEQKSVIEKFYKAVISLLDVFRIGIIVTLFEPREENVLAIYNKYLKTPYTARSSEITVRMNILQQIKGFILNCISTIESTEMHIERNGEQEDRKGVLILLDVNNAPESGKILSAENMSTIITTAINHIKPNGLKEMI